MTKDDIKKLVAQYKNDRSPIHRYASFDYCFNYFRNFKEEGRLSELKSKNNLEMSCLQIGFFLASWGMFRGKAQLGQKASVKHFAELVEEISSWHGDHKLAGIWDIDANDYEREGVRDCLINCYKEVRKKVAHNSGQAHRTLVTKVMLGVFGCVPAFDDLFTSTFRNLYREDGCAFRSFNHDALLKLADFYKNHSDTIAELAKETKTLDFETGKSTRRNYKQAKIIDMIGFQEGKNKGAKRAKKANL
jgi:hypothetical protein